MQRAILSVSGILLGLASLASAYSGGSGTPEDPYQLATAQDLVVLGRIPADYDKAFVLTADIDLSGLRFDRAVIAPDTNDATYLFQGTPFSGRFDGQGHTIHHLNILGKFYLGLFGEIGPGAVIANLGS